MEGEEDRVVLDLPRGTALLRGAPVTPQRLPELIGDQPQAIRWIAAHRLRFQGLHCQTRAPALRQYREMGRLAA